MELFKERKGEILYIYYNFDFSQFYLIYRYIMQF